MIAGVGGDTAKDTDVSGDTASSPSTCTAVSLTLPNGRSADGRHFHDPSGLTGTLWQTSTSATRTTILLAGTPVPRTSGRTSRVTEPGAGDSMVGAGGAATAAARSIATQAVATITTMRTARIRRWALPGAERAVLSGRRRQAIVGSFGSTWGFGRRRPRGAQ